MATSYLIAWLLPLLVGCGVCCLLAQPRQRGGLAAMLGSGWLVGVLLAGLAAQWLARDDTLHAVARVAPWLGGLGALAWLGVWLRWRRHSPIATPAPAPAAPAWRGLWWLLLALVALRLVLLADEAALRPVFAWDAWSAWAVRPKSWILLGRADAYVPMIDWLAGAPSPARTMMAWNYPQLLAWIEVWFASGAGGWNEPLVNLAWSGALVAFAFAFHGYLRGFGLPAWLAMVLVYVLVSLPLIDAHVALAGYADLWVALVLGLALLAWARWLLFREPRQWLLAVLLVACLPAIKLEGAIWLLAFVAVALLERLPRQWRWVLPGGVVLLLAVILGADLLGVPLPSVGKVHIGWGRIDIAGVASYTLKWHAVGGPMLASLYELPNWHLLWYLLPALIVWRWRDVCRSEAARLLGLFVLLQLAALFVLFFLTSASAWAEDFTSVNRLILQVVPGVLVFVAVLLRDPASANEKPVRETDLPGLRKPAARG
ncbi:hypothetical protein [Dokdonella sp.]|uniref:hypothetical protein n=1 Tax=Dokdonella sp. TaxID=2291710 RepID=UPI0031C4C638|nr:hypothetical protein [Dokdonella sp.]